MNLTDELSLRLGTALLHSLWQLAGLSLALAAVLTFVGRAAARLRALLASLTLLTAFALFAVTAASVDAPSTSRPAVVPGQAITLPAYQPGRSVTGQTSSAAPVVEPVDASPAAASSLLPDARVLLTGLWLIGVATLTLRHTLGLIHVQRLRLTASPTDHPAVAAAVDHASAILRVSKRIPVLVSDRLTSPALVGLVKPVVLLPASALSGLPASQIELLVAHEYAHLKHLDPFLNHLTNVAETVFFYHPATWWITRVIRREREFACDDAVVSAFGRRHDYARALTSVQELAINAPGTPRPALSASGHRSTFAARIHRILGLQPTGGPSPASALALIGISALALAVSAAETSPPTAQTDRAPGTRGDILDRNGTVIATSPSPQQRAYPLGANLSHVAGYTSPENGLHKGRSGIELSVDKSLAAGDDVYLTVDASIQTAAEKVMRSVGRGAAVVLDPRSGEILALVSVPSFAPLAFADGISEADFRALLENPAKPLFNRTLGTYPPASTFKLVSSLAAANAGKASASFDCSGTTLIDGRKFRCWKRDGHGTLGLGEALTTSCNCYFYELATEIGAAHIHGAATSLGFASRTGIHLPNEAAGHLFDPAESTPASLANHTIGHGQVLATPLQIAAATATIANGGTRHTPRIISRITDFETSTTSETVPETRPTATIPAAHLTQVRNAMRDVVNSPNGTGRRARSADLVIAGKSGTAQTVRSQNGTRVQEYTAWFTAFAPFDAPEIVVTVVVENGTAGGTTSAPLVKKIIEQTLLNQLPKPTPLPPHQGHLDKITAPD